ncbi:TPA: AbrB/MazE/SpoVT family DNA-binding domain-containing protein [Candidatus Micrarchaeota archaeon]|nr:AbrB/MazE/SpoVT family DNA-binding domain-containing protein [Candidatus Micrarchaeota archaeon]
MASEVEAQVAKMSSKGQVVIPEDIREDMNLHAGSTFVVFGNKNADSILLKRLVVPEPTKAFEEMAKWGRQHAKSLGLDVRPEKIVEKQHKK